MREPEKGDRPSLKITLLIFSDRDRFCDKYASPQPDQVANDTNSPTDCDLIKI
ncbi:hypothetical protein AB3R30_24260 [Leptolyngbyaceae cyanobacterium UHCC 1019]